MKLYAILFLAAALFTVHLQANAGEDVTVTWTPPDLTEVPYSGYKLYWTDSSGTESFMVIPDKNQTQVLVNNVDFGASLWHMTSLCAACEITESAVSNTVAFTVKFKGVPQPPTLSNVKLSGG
jgi:hypothetical protein